MPRFACLGCSLFPRPRANGLQDDCWPSAAIYVSVYMLFNMGYSVLLILLIKHGSSSLLWLVRRESAFAADVLSLGCASAVVARVR